MFTLSIEEGSNSSRKAKYTQVYSVHTCLKQQQQKRFLLFSLFYNLKPKEILNDLTHAIVNSDLIVTFEPLQREMT